MQIFITGLFQVRLVLKVALEIVAQSIYGYW